MFRALVEYSFVLLNWPYVPILRSHDKYQNEQKLMLNIMSTSWTALPCGCYILSETDNISMLPIGDYAWTEHRFMQLVSTFAYVYFKDVSALLESICYLGSHTWYIIENEIKQARQKKKEERKKNN